MARRPKKTSQNNLQNTNRFVVFFFSFFLCFLINTEDYQVNIYGTRVRQQFYIYITQSLFYVQGIVYLLIGTVIYEVGQENANGDVKLKEYVQTATYPCGCNLRKEHRHGLSSYIEILSPTTQIVYTSILSHKLQNKKQLFSCDCMLINLIRIL